MDKEYIRRRLPEKAPEALLNWAKKELYSDLGGGYCVFHAERVPVDPSLEEIIEHNSLDPRKKVWAAVCTCTECQEDFITQKEPGANCIYMIQGEDGSYYTVNPGEPVDPYMGIERQKPGDKFYCPYCGSEVELIHSKQVRGGRKKQVMVVSVDNVEGYTGIFYWMVWRTIDEDGISDYGADPKDAFVLTENGGIVRFSNQTTNGMFGSLRWLPEWRIMSSNRDTIRTIYHDWGSCRNRKQGAALWEVYPELGGTTGEKTGLVEYLQADGIHPVEYLKYWRRYRGLENLCKCGQARLVADIMRSAYRFSYQVEAAAEQYIELKLKKPHEMLRLSKAEFRHVRREGISLTMAMLRQFRDYCYLARDGSFLSFLSYRKKFGSAGLESAFRLIRNYPDVEIDKLARYMEKQGLNPGENGLLYDTREMTARFYGGRILTREELWPRRLLEAHDRISQMIADRDNRDKATQLAEGFQRVRDWYGHLEWTDGELSVILPKENADLVREGSVLRHCVGGYGKNHAKGESLIFFIRHYRRPERPYYTLNISMKGMPKELQLHGYGNERHGPNKEYSHKIPAKVRAFCDRWENEVLFPWYAEQQRKQQEELSV